MDINRTHTIIVAIGWTVTGGAQCTLQDAAGPLRRQAFLRRPAARLLSVVFAVLPIHLPLVLWLVTALLGKPWT